MEILSQPVCFDDKNALLSVFPSSETLLHFIRNDRDVAEKALPEFIRFAWERGFIAAKTEKAFTDFIEKEAGKVVAASLPEGFSFNDLIDRISENQSVNSFIESELRPIAREFHLPEVQASMISRLRQNFNPNTRGKLNLMRVLAFWIGGNRSYWGWNYHTLLQLKDTVIHEETDRNEGVRLAFQMEIRDDILGQGTIEWLKNELYQSMKELDIFYIDRKQILSSATTVFVSIPKMKGCAGDMTLYATALRNAVALAHQISVRWSLSEHSRPGTRLRIAMAAGAFADSDIILQAMMKAGMPEGDVIWMTPFVRMCANLAEIKIVFNDQPKEIRLYDGETLPVWGAGCLWSHIYYDFVPAVLKLLPADSESYETFRKTLYFGDAKNNRTVAFVHRHVQNTMLILEIAKSCLARGMFHEADYFMSVILANKPFHVVARTLRMIVRLNIALAQPDFSVALISFREAVNEGRFIIEHCRVEDEEVFCELGQIHFCIAKRLYNILRKDKRETVRIAREGTGAEAVSEPITDADRTDTLYENSRKTLRKQVMEHLKKAQECFENGRTISPSGMGNRSLHWSFRIRALQRVLATDSQAFGFIQEPGKTVLTDRFDIFRQTAKEMFSVLGWAKNIPENGSEYSETEESELFNHIFRVFGMYDNAVLLKTYSVNIKYATTILLFDFTPKLTALQLELMLSWLKQARNDARKLNSSELGIHTIVTCFSQVQPIRCFLNRVSEAARIIEAENDNALKRDKGLGSESDRSFKFFLSNFSEEERIDYPFFG